MGRTRRMGVGDRLRYAPASARFAGCSAAAGARPAPRGVGAMRSMLQRDAVTSCPR
jgi:hypothetical protein